MTKPNLTLMGAPFTAEKLAALFEHLTGRKIDMEESRRGAVRIAEKAARLEKEKAEKWERDS